MLRPELVGDLDRARAIEVAWDRLAVACSRPYAAPGWMLPWWDHLAPRSSELRIALAWSGNELVGAAPLHSVRRGGATWLRPLAWTTSHATDPLALPGCEREAAHALATALAGAAPSPAALSVEAAAGSPWPALLADAWPLRGARVVRGRTNVAPVVELQGRDLEEWLAGRSRNLRSQVRRMQRRMQRGSGDLSRVEGTAIQAALGDFARLHHARWRDRGGSAALSPNVERMLADAADRLPPGRMWLWQMSVGEKVVASHLFVGAGRQANYWLGGHDRAYDDWKPGLLTLAVAAADAGGRGFERLDLGPGPQEYKLRLADTKALLSWAAVVPGGRRSALPYVWLAAERGSRLVRGTAIRRGGRAAGPPRAPASPASRD